jgi:hypothetical protein
MSDLIMLIIMYKQSSKFGTWSWLGTLHLRSDRQGSHGAGGRGRAGSRARFPFAATRRTIADAFLVEYRWPTVRIFKRTRNARDRRYASRNSSGKMPFRVAGRFDEHGACRSSGLCKKLKAWQCCNGIEGQLLGEDKSCS